MLLIHVQMKLMDVIMTRASTATLMKCTPTLLFTPNAPASFCPQAKPGTWSPTNSPTQKLVTNDTRKPSGVKMGRASLPGRFCTVQRT